MSDQSQGEGWWIASDGKWYPPESAPGYQAPVTPPADLPNVAPPTIAGHDAPGAPPAAAPYQPESAPGAPSGGFAAPTTDTSDSGGGNKMVMLIVGGLVGLLAIGGVAAIALSGGDDDTPTETVADSTTTPEAETTTSTAEDEPVDDETTTTSSAAAPASGGESLDDPLPLAGTGFEYEYFSGTQWSGTFFGVVEVPVRDGDPGACYLVLGTMSPTSIDEGNVTSGFDTPDISAVANGAIVDPGFSDCEQDDAVAAGYSRIYDAEITAGSTYAFFSELYVEGDVPPELQAIVLGSANDDDARYYTVDILGSIPPAPESVGVTGTGDNQPLIGATFTFQSFSDAVWQGELFGLLPVDTGRFNDEDGACYLVLGSIVPESLPEGFVTNSFSTPDVGALAGGEFIDRGFSDCDDTAAIEAGYRPILDAYVTVGTSFAFYTEIFIPASNGSPIESIIVGNATDDDALYYSPDEITEVPIPTRVVGEVAPDLNPLAGSGFTFTSFSDTSWEGSVTGMVASGTDSFFDGEGQCFLIVGVITPTEIGEGTATSGFDTPDFSLLADGYNYGPSFGGCDRDPAIDVGYGWILDAEVTVGTAYPFVVDVFIPGGDPTSPDALVLGSASSDDAIYYEPLVLDSIPAP